ncbi:MAG: hypothetical protein ACFE0J_12380 [Elainellaceae cyanobacterium]
MTTYFSLGEGDEILQGRESKTPEKGGCPIAIYRDQANKAFTVIYIWDNGGYGKWVSQVATCPKDIRRNVEGIRVDTRSMICQFWILDFGLKCLCPARLSGWSSVALLGGIGAGKSWLDREPEPRSQNSGEG